MAHVMEQAAKLSKRRDLEGTPKNPTSSNSFEVLNNNEIMLRASLMGVDIPNDKFESVDLLRNLEEARNQLHNKNSISDSKLYVHHGMGERNSLQIEWPYNANKADSDNEPFTLVESRKNKRKNSKRNVCFSAPRPITRSQNKASTSTMVPGRSTRRRNTPERFK